MEAEVKKQLDNTRMQLGLIDVKGPGIIITITPKTNILEEVVLIKQEILVIVKYKCSKFIKICKSRSYFS